MKVCWLALFCLEGQGDFVSRLMSEILRATKWLLEVINLVTQPRDSKPKTLNPNTIVVSISFYIITKSR